ncbi:hypothetical protein [Shimia abyssi]|uniref:Uncharacterized protein n=1 Tax=Shimia abyssi TaxID=1662395 RepID=A0A2P8FHN6_9RHOB|nr:hypothetical protein [Shimia abyssi]PSL21239.1 hypothetical protein CLV88_102359 [Shimia abyssi]
MSHITLTKTRLFEGVWEGVLRVEGGDDAPTLDVTYLDNPVPDVTVAKREDGEGWAVQVPIPVEALCDGAQTILINDQSSGERLESITFISGEALADDLRAELDLLRAELDMLKRAFRRHCVETM